MIAWSPNLPAVLHGYALKNAIAGDHDQAILVLALDRCYSYGSSADETLTPTGR